MCFQTDGWWGVTNLVCVNNNHHQLFRKSGGSNDFGKSSNVFVTYQTSFNLVGYFFFKKIAMMTRMVYAAQKSFF